MSKDIKKGIKIKCNINYVLHKLMVVLFGSVGNLNCENIKSNARKIIKFIS